MTTGKKRTCCQSEMQQQHPANLTPPSAVPTTIEARSSNIEDSIAVLVASINTIPKVRTMVSRPAIKKMVLISPVSHGLENILFDWHCKTVGRKLLAKGEMVPNIHS